MSGLQIGAARRQDECLDPASSQNRPERCAELRVAIVEHVATLIELVRLASLAARSHSALAAENLFLRKQLALFQERKIKPRRADDSIRWMMATLSRMFPWRDALVNVKADTLLRWHRKGFRLFWRWKSKPTGRPRLPRDLRDLIRKMAAENPIWGEERIANELKMKLGIRVSPRTVGKYLSSGGPRREPDPKQRWLTFVRNHAKAIVACDFFVVVTACGPEKLRSADFQRDVTLLHSDRRPSRPQFSLLECR